MPRDDRRVTACATTPQAIVELELADYLRFADIYPFGDPDEDGDAIARWAWQLAEYIGRRTRSDETAAYVRALAKDAAPEVRLNAVAAYLRDVALPEVRREEWVSVKAGSPLERLTSVESNRP